MTNFDKINNSRIDITDYIYNGDFHISNHLNDDKVVALMSVGVPCGAIQSVLRR